jgi:alkylation response protein AidB-like acyl-CoA dehydrogenase
MDFELSDEQQLLRATVRRFLAERAPIAWVRSMLDDPRGTTDDVWSATVGLGIVGTGLGMLDLGVVLEEMGRAVHPGPFLATAVGATALADDELLDAVRAGATATVAFDADGVMDAGDRFTGGARWVLDGSTAGTVVLPVDERIYAVERAATGVVADPQPTVDATRRWAHVRFDAAPARRVDAPVSLDVARDRMVTAFAVDGVGCAGRALEIAVDYANTRVQFGKPIGSFQAVAHLCTEMLQNVELGWAGAYYALWALDGADREEAHRAATMAKAFTSDGFVRVGASLIQVHGGIGFTWDHDAHLYYKRLLTLQHALGGTVEHLEELARIVLD